MEVSGQPQAKHLYSLERICNITHCKGGWMGWGQSVHNGKDKCPCLGCEFEPKPLNSQSVSHITAFAIVSYRKHECPQLSISLVKHRPCSFTLWEVYIRKTVAFRYESHQTLKVIQCSGKQRSCHPPEECVGWHFLKALYTAGSGQWVGYGGSDWQGRTAICYPTGDKHVVQ
jgi:hypothetical protein